jgi:hypothetical protein
VLARRRDRSEPDCRFCGFDLAGTKKPPKGGFFVQCIYLILEEFW